MSTITKSVDVDVDVATAYNQWTQFESFPKFMEGVEEIQQLDDTHTHWRVKVAGTTREFDARITEQKPDERIAWRSEKGDMNRFKEYIESRGGHETGAWRGEVDRPGS